MAAAGSLCARAEPCCGGGMARRWIRWCWPARRSLLRVRPRSGSCRPSQPRTPARTTHSAWERPRVVPQSSRRSHLYRLRIRPLAQRWPAHSVRSRQGCLWCSSSQHSGPLRFRLRSAQSLQLLAVACVTESRRVWNTHHRAGAG